MQYHVIIVDNEHFLNNLEVFTNKDHCNVTRTFIKDDLFEGDEVERKLRNDKNKASKKYYDYVYDKRHNFKK